MDRAHGSELYKNVFFNAIWNKFYSYLWNLCLFLGLQLIALHWCLECSMSSFFILSPAFYFMIMEIKSGCTFFWKQSCSCGICFWLRKLESAAETDVSCGNWHSYYLGEWKWTDDNWLNGNGHERDFYWWNGMK